MKIFPESNMNLEKGGNLANLEVIDFLDDIDFQEWIEDDDNEDYMDISGRKILESIYWEDDIVRLNLFIASIDGTPSIVYIHRYDFVKYLDRLMVYYAKLDEFELCDIFKEAKNIMIKKRG